MRVFKKVYAFNVPVAYNNGKPVSDEQIEAIEAPRLVELFGGFTIEALAPGAWGRQRESNRWYKVYLESRDASKLYKVVMEIGVNLGQDCIVLEHRRCVAEFIDTRLMAIESGTIKAD